MWSEALDLQILQSRRVSGLSRSKQALQALA